MWIWEGGIIGEENVMADTRMRKNGYGPMRKMAFLENIKL